MAKVKTHGHPVALDVIDPRDEARRVNSVRELLGLGIAPSEGHSIHVMSGGAVDMFSYAMWLVKIYGGIDYLFTCSWRYGVCDILLLERMLKKGEIKKMDMCLNVAYSSSHVYEWQYITKMHEGGLIDHLVASNVHLKFICAECGGKKIVIESSANFNNNNRIELSTIFVSEELFKWYMIYMNDIYRQWNFGRTLKELLPNLKTIGKYEQVDDIEGFASCGQDDLCEEFDGEE